METKLNKKDAEIKIKLDKKNAEMQTKLDKKDAEMQMMQARVLVLEKKVNSGDLPGAVAEAVWDLPIELVSVFKSNWATPDATITYERYLPGGGDGALDLATGVFTCLIPGFYTVTFSGYSWLDPGKENMIYVHVRGVLIAESRYRDSSSNGVGDTIQTQGSKTMVSPLTPTHPDPPPLPGRHPRAEGP